MRSGLSTIQQTLTAEAAAVLNRSIAEAARRGHGQTTPLHVAATLLSSPSGILRNACARSHHASAHPLHCRALDLCFSVALDRLPSFTNSTNSSVNGEQQQMPPISNALMAALKRAQAHQRRGCPEQQQQPILAVRVELEQLVISILDDPGVSRVMREASFSSPAVKLVIELSLSSSTTATSASAATRSNLHVSQRVAGEQQKDEIKIVIDVLVRTKKRNPILVGDDDPSSVIKGALRCVEDGDAPASLIGVKIVSVENRLSSGDKAELPAKIRELDGIIEAQIGGGGVGGGGGIVLDLGDLKWLVENGWQQQTVSEAGRAAVAEMGRLVARYGSGGRLWLVGTATCPTYLRCQVYYPSMEADWDLQAIPVAARSPPILPRSGGSGILSSSIESLSPAAKGFPAMPLSRPGDIIAAGSRVCVGPRRTTLCSQCAENYDHELGKLAAEEMQKPSSESQPVLPKWLQIAPPINQSQEKNEEMRKLIAEELNKKWLETCARNHPYLNAGGGRTPPPPSTSLSMANAFSLIPQPRQNLKTTTLSQPSSQKTPVTAVSSPVSPPSSPVRTDLALGQNVRKNRLRDFSPGCLQDQNSDDRSDGKSDKGSGIVDLDSFKRLFTGLTEKVTWQPEAASSVATVVMHVKLGNGKRRSYASKSDTWLLFLGPDKVGKRRMAAALSELVCGSAPITINLPRPRSNAGESELSLRGKTCMDRIAETVRSNPFSVVHLEEFDGADAIVCRTIKRAIESGRLPDSYGREISLGSVIFILSSSWVPDDIKNSQKPFLRSEEKIIEAADGRWQLELSIGEQSPAKRRADWICEGEPAAKRAGLSLDLNLSVGADDDAAAEGSRNSSDLTVEHDHNIGSLAINQQASSLSTELLDAADQAIIFKPVDFGPLRSKVSDSLSTKFASIAGAGKLLLVDEDALDRLVGGVWLAGPAMFDEWAETVLVPNFYQLKGNLKSDDGLIVRLSVAKYVDRHDSRAGGDDWLPKSVLIRPTYDGYRR